MEKVYVLEVGEYSSRYVAAVFATREAAEGYRRTLAQRDYERYLTNFKIRPPVGFEHFIDENGNDASRERHFQPQSFETFLAGTDYCNDFGEVEEYDLWDVVPALPLPRPWERDE